MYKSVEKSKNRKAVKTESFPKSTEEELKAIKSLYAKGKISDAEYQKRKQKLLDDL